MKLIVDKNFERDYKKFFGNIKTKVLLEKEIDKLISNAEQNILIDISNIIKTATVMGATYTDCQKAAAKISVKESTTLLTLSLVLGKMIINRDYSVINSLVKSTRDIYKEITATHLNIFEEEVKDEMIRDTLAVAKKFVDQSHTINECRTKSWDEYFYNISRQVARNSKCLSRKIGAVLVRDKSIISTGYNGPPRGVSQCDMRWVVDYQFKEKYKDRVDLNNVEGMCPRYIIGFKSGEGLRICPAGHAERNTLINAGRHGICTKGSTLFMTCCIPCSPCLVEIINAGVEEIVVASLEIYDESAEYLLSQSNLKVRLFDFIK